jgi:hypothetical protein
MSCRHRQTSTWGNCNGQYYTSYCHPSTQHYGQHRRRINCCQLRRSMSIRHPHYTREYDLYLNLQPSSASSPDYMRQTSNAGPAQCGLVHPISYRCPRCAPVYAVFLRRPLDKYLNDCSESSCHYWKRWKCRVQSRSSRCQCCRRGCGYLVQQPASAMCRFEDNM